MTETEQSKRTRLADNREWLRANPGALERVGVHNYWTVTDRDGNYAGDVLGDGPTKETRFKAIHVNDQWMNPEEAPAVAYGTSKEEAAAHLI